MQVILYDYKINFKYMSVNEFENFIEDIAKQQRQLLDYMKKEKVSYLTILYIVK